ncbi:MAG TPA: LTA synthase family protein [Steroidobacteraceae bacterium]|nr:LTA synthase family protein [Steroidobacteraceae bacterium]
MASESSIVAHGLSRDSVSIGHWRAVQAWLGPYGLMLRFMLPVLLLLSASRLLLMAWQWRRVAETDAVAWMLAQGVRSDLITIGVCIAPALLALPMLLMMKRMAWWEQLCKAWFALCFIVISFLELATPQFLIEYDGRPGTMLLQYLAYPGEVSAMLWQGYRGTLFTTLLVLGGATWWSIRYFRVAEAPAIHLRALRAALLWPVMVILAVLMIRSSLEHRPANLASFLFCDDAMVNSLVANSAYTVLSASLAMRAEDQTGTSYGSMPHEVIVRRVRADMGVPPARFTSDQLPTLHRQQPSVQRTRPLNLVIVLEESLGAGFVERLGGLPVTPTLNRLADQGIWFERLYATGTRSIRGIEAVVAGFPPTPALSVVKLPNAQRDFTTLASLLRRSGFRSEFVYGGESHFDNMRGFFLGNGFNAVVDRSQFNDPQFVGSWGASDEDLFAKAHERIEALHGQQQSFFLLVFSSSNHTPFEYPDGRIEQFDAEKHTVNNAVKYADYALGQFLDQARSSDYWRDTLFLVVADHDTRVHGSALVPLDKFHIPGVILGADVAPLKVQSIVSQIDLAPTLLSLMGVDNTHPMPGRDLTRTLPEFGNSSGPPPRAMMQYEQSYARLQGNVLTVLLPNGTARDFSVGDAGRQLTPIEHNDPERHRDALASVLMPAWIYRERRYRVEHALLSN